MEPVVVIAAVVVALALVGFVVWAARRHRYVRAFAALGWQFVNRPAISIIHGLNVPPFGLGFDRSVDEQVSGRTSSGLPFQAFAYSSGGHRERGFVVTMPLARSLPEFHLVPLQRQRPGTTAGVVAESSTHVALADDVAFGRSVTELLGPHLPPFPTTHPADLTIDHDQLVALGAPSDAAGLQPFVDALAPLVQALSDPRLASYVGPTKPAELGCYGRPDWVYRVRDDAMLGHVRATGGGRHHRAWNVIFCGTAPLPFIRLTHTWETTRTVTESDGRGGTRTRTVTDHHSEEVFEIQPTFPFRDVKVNAGWFGNKRTFESSDFNEEFTVRAGDPRFAHDVFHPRMMEYLMATRPGPFVHDGQGRLTIEFTGSTTSIEAALEFFTGFFARVPNFVWEQLGLTTPPLPLHGQRA